MKIDEATGFEYVEGKEPVNCAECDYDHKAVLEEPCRSCVDLYNNRTYFKQKGGALLYTPTSK